LSSKYPPYQTAPGRFQQQARSVQSEKALRVLVQRLRQEGKEHRLNKNMLGPVI
jgi:hypothetical protein